MVLDPLIPSPASVLVPASVLHATSPGSEKNSLTGAGEVTEGDDNPQTNTHS